MTATLAPVAALLLGAAVLLTGHGLQGTLLPVRAQIESFSTLSVGVLGSAYYIGFVLGCLACARLVSRVGHIRVYTSMTAIATAAVLVHALVVNAPVWWLVRGVSGFCLAALYVIIESWLNERATNETRGRILSVYLVINLTVMTIGQMMVAVADPREFLLFAVAAMLLCLAAVPVALGASTAPEPIQGVRLRIWRLYRISPVGFVGCLVVGLTNGAFWSLSPAFATGVGLSVAGVATFMSVAVIAGAAGQWPIGRASDRVDRRVVVLGACGAAALAGVALALAPTRFEGGPFALAACWGLFSFPLYAVAVAHSNDFAAPDEFVELSSGLMLVFAAGAVVGPLIAAGAMGVLGPGGLFAFTASAHALLALFALARIRARAPAPLEEHVPFVESLEAVQTVSPVFDAEIQAEHLGAGKDPRASGASADSPGAARGRG